MEEEEDTSVPLCWLCEQPGALPETLAGLSFHKDCRKAVRNKDSFIKSRSENLSLPAQKKVLQDERKTMKDNAGEWRKHTLKFLGDTPLTEKKEARKLLLDARLSVKQSAVVSGELDMEDDPVLTKQSYRQHRHASAGIDASTADAEFEKLFEQQDGMYSHTSGVARVRVQSLDGKVRQFKGREEREGVISQVEIDEHQESLLRSQMSKKSVQLNIHRRRTPGDAGRSPSPAAKRPQPKPNLQRLASGVFPEDNEIQRHGASSDTLSRAGSRDGLDGGGSQAGDPRPSPKKKREHGEGAAFPMRKDKLKQSIQDSWLQVAGDRPSSLKKSLAKAFDSLRERDGLNEKDLPHEPANLETSLDTLAKKCVDLKQRTQACTPVNIDQLVPEVDALAIEVADSSVKVKDQLAAIGYMSERRVSEQRAAYAKIYWQCQKTHGKLVEGGFCAAQAKFLAEYISQHSGHVDDTKYQVDFSEAKNLLCNAALDKFDAEVPMLWAPASAGAKEISAALLSALGAQDALDTKKAALESKMNQEPKWLGTHGDLLHVQMDFSKLSWPEGKELHKQDEPGAAPWLACMKRHARRHGPVAMPMQGVPFFLLPQRDLFVHMFPGHILVSSGIPVSSYAHYAGTPEGLARVKESSTTAFVQQGAACFVPAGYITTMVFVKDPAAPKAKGSRAAPITVETATAILVPVPLKKQLSGMTEPLKTAFLAWMREETKEKNSKMWEDRVSFLAEAFKF